MDSLIEDIIQAVYGPAKLNNSAEYTKQDISKRLTPWLAGQGAAIWRELDGRDDYSRQPINVLRRVLSEAGYRLKYRQVRRDDGERCRLYRLARVSQNAICDSERELPETASRQPFAPLPHIGGIIRVSVMRTSDYGVCNGI